MYSISVAASILGVCIKTLRRWDKAKKIKCVRTLGGHRRFPIQEIKRILEGKATINETKEVVLNLNNNCAIYGRVSSHKQNKRGDLARQIDFMKEFAREENLHIYKVYNDVGSGLNTNRRGLWRMIRDAKKGKFSSLVINFKDRLTRFGYKYLKSYLNEFGVEIVCLNKLADKSPESEMIEDLVAIIHSFSGKLYGMRSKRHQKLQQ